MSDLLKFSVPGKPEYVAMVRMAVSALANNIGFDIEQIEDIKVAVSEACTNVVCHCPKQQSCYEVFCELSESKIAISVADQGGGYDTTAYHTPNLDCPRQGGLGIFIIRTLMDEVDICSEVGNGTVIKMVKYCGKE